MTRPTENFLWNVHRNTLNLLANRCLEPLAIQFSGGRTSAYMLRRLLDLYGGAFPDTVRVTFYNTGLEHPETLNFVHRVETEWNVPITWLEYDPHAAHKVRLVNHNSASRDGRPFWDLFTVPVERRRDGTRGLRPLPGPGMRICTAQLKIELGYRYLTKVIGWPAKWGYYEAIGLRYDEPRRVDKQRAPRALGTYDTIPIHPLYDLGITAQTIFDFWSRQSFNLNLPMDDPRWGNCVACFLKSADKLKRNFSDDPSAADLMIALEDYPRDRISRFRADRPSYRELRDRALAGDLGFEREDPFVNDCNCTE